jgi:hypothetical protein
MVRANAAKRILEMVCEFNVSLPGKFAVIAIRRAALATLSRLQTGVHACSSRSSRPNHRI